jgi:hypothetical protein
MAKNRDWQERGVRIGSRVFDETESAALVREVRKRVKDPDVIAEIEDFLDGKRKTLSARSRDVLYVVAVSVVMMSRK